MTAVPHQRRILDRRALAAGVAGLSGRGLDDESLRREFIALLRAALTDGRKTIRRRFERGASGPPVMRSVRRAVVPTR